MKEKIVLMILVTIVFLLLVIGVVAFGNMMRDHYCFTTPYDEMKNSSICKEYWKND